MNTEKPSIKKEGFNNHKINYDDDSKSTLTLLYNSVTLDDDEIIVSLNTIFKPVYDKNRNNANLDDVTRTSFICPVLKSSDGEVRTFGIHKEFVDYHVPSFIFYLKKSEAGKKLVKNLWEYDWSFHIYYEIIQYEHIENTVDSDNYADIPREYNKTSFRRSDKTDFVTVAFHSLLLYYCYTKYIYDNDLSNIESKDQKLIKFIDSKANLSESELNEVIKIYYDKFYEAHILQVATNKRILKITLDSYYVEWNYNKFLYYIANNEELNQASVIILLPVYQYFKFIINIGTFVVNDKLLFKLKFNSNVKTLHTNVFLGGYKGKALYQNLLDIKNDTKNIAKFEQKDYHNLFIMNFINLRFLHLTGIIHNDLHLNNILFQQEPEIESIYIDAEPAYKLKVFDKFYLHLGKIDFTIIDFGRACYINDKDLILKRVKKINKDFYNQYLPKINDMFEKDEYMTGFVLSMFDYIEYIQSVVIGFKWINSTDIDYEMLSEIVKYCYQIIICYLTGKPSALSKKLYKILKHDNYRLLPDIVRTFDPHTEKRTYDELSDLIFKNGGYHPIDLIIEKFYQENIYDDQDYEYKLYSRI